LAPTISIIIPAYNEEHRLPDTLTKILRFLEQQSYQAEILVVENGSQDRTAAIGREFAQQHPNLELHQEARAGKGLAVRRGMLAARGAYRFICDADLSMPIEQLNRFLPPKLDSYDIAIASREAPGAQRYNEPAYRHWIGRIFNWIVRLIALPGLQDTQCGFKCFRATVAEDLFQAQLLEGWTFDVEVLFLARKRGYQIVEIPIDWYHIRGSRVHVLRDSIAMFTDLLRIRWKWMRGAYSSNVEETQKTA